MGNIVSTIGSDIDSVVTSVSKLVTDVGGAVKQLSSIASGFAAPPAGQLSAAVKTSPYAITLGDPNDINSALKAAMNGAKAKAMSLFAAQFSGVTAAGQDMGVVSGYVSGTTDVPCVVGQMTNDFKIWEISTDPTTIQGMATTIATNVNAQLGMTGTAQGHHSLNMNEKIDWVVAYGIFEMGDNSQGLVYAYVAALDSGF
jgi:hypothetical protein